MAERRTGPEVGVQAEHTTPARTGLDHGDVQLAASGFFVLESESKR